MDGGMHRIKVSRVIMPEHGLPADPILFKIKDTNG
jgi:hypothetical protein